jgi:hypothetical protein
VICEKPAAARADELEPLVEELIFKLARSRRPAGTDRRVLDGEARVEAAKDAMQSYRDDPNLQRRLGMTSFGAGLAKRQELFGAGAVGVGDGSSRHPKPAGPAPLLPALLTSAHSPA